MFLSGGFFMGIPLRLYWRQACETASQRLSDAGCSQQMSMAYFRHAIVRPPIFSSLATSSYVNLQRDFFTFTRSVVDGRNLVGYCAD